jgi:hypothetical protein
MEDSYALIDLDPPLIWGAQGGKIKLNDALRGLRVRETVRFRQSIAIFARMLSAVTT